MVIRFTCSTHLEEGIAEGQPLVGITVQLLVDTDMHLALRDTAEVRSLVASEEHLGSLVPLGKRVAAAATEDRG